MAENKGVSASKVSKEEQEHAEEVNETSANPVIKDGGTVVTQHDKDVIDHAREVLKKEAEGLEGVSGPADNFSGSQATSPEDHIFSNDPYKKAFPPGPDDPTKL